MFVRLLRIIYEQRIKLVQNALDHMRASSLDWMCPPHNENNLLFLDRKMKRTIWHSFGWKSQYFNMVIQKCLTYYIPLEINQTIPTVLLISLRDSIKKFTHPGIAIGLIIRNVYLLSLSQLHCKFKSVVVLYRIEACH